jgi:DNA-binding Xre family transcriptional regulator
MRVSCKNLLKLFIDRDMKKKDLQVAAGLSSTKIVKFSHGGLDKSMRYSRC